MAKTGDKLLIGGALLAGLAALMWYGDKLVKDASNSFAKGLQLPNFSVTMPSITMPNITMPNVNVSLGSGISGLGDALSQSQQYKDLQAKYNALQDALNKKVQPAYTGPTQPAENTMLWSGNTNAARKADIEKNGIGPLFASSPVVPSSPAGSSSAGGGGIWVPDPKVQGGGYYVQDNSLYGGSSGMPSPVVPSSSGSQNTTFEGKAYSTRGYSGTVGGYRDYLNSVYPGQGDSWLTKAKLNPSGYGI